MTMRQRVRELTTQGKTIKEIAMVTGLSVHGVRYHRRPPEFYAEQSQRMMKYRRRGKQ